MAEVNEGEGVRGDALGSTSDPGEMGSTRVKTRPKVGHIEENVTVNAGVRGAALGSTSDLGKMGDTIVETRPKVGQSEANVAMGGHSNPVNGMLPGVEQPMLDSGDPVTWATKSRHRKENKRKFIAAVGSGTSGLLATSCREIYDPYTQIITN